MVGRVAALSAVQNRLNGADTDRAADKDPIDATLSPVTGWAEPARGERWSSAIVGHDPGILQPLTGRHSPRVADLRDRVEVAGDDDRAARRKRRDTGRDRRGRIELRLSTSEGEVGIEDVDLLASRQVMESGPGDDSGNAPAGSRPVGSRGKPEGPGLDWAQFGVLVEDRRVFADALTTVERAVDPEPPITPGALMPDTRPAR